MFKGLSDTRLAIVILALIATAIWHCGRETGPVDSRRETEFVLVLFTGASQ